MEKVICLKCKELGYTASPQSARCQCGGSLVAIDENTPKIKENQNHENLTYIKQ